MKGFNLRAIESNKLSANGRDLYQKVEALQIKRATQGGLDYLDQFNLGDMIRKLNDEINSPVEALDVNEVTNDTQQTGVLNAAIPITEAPEAYKVLKGFIAELKKLPTDIRPKDEQWSENPRYTAYMKSLPEKEQPRKIEVSLERVQHLKKFKK